MIIIKLRKTIIIIKEHELPQQEKIVTKSAEFLSHDETCRMLIITSSSQKLTLAFK